MRTLMSWKGLLPQLVQVGEYRRQSDLVQALAARGFAVNQGTVSRELTALGIRKQGGIYCLPVEGVSGLAAPIHNIRVTANGCMAVILTDPAYASVVAQHIDEAAVPGVLGTIAGDDTVFACLFDQKAEEPLRALLGRRR